LAEDLSERKGSDGLDERGRARRREKRHQKLPPPLADHIVQEPLRGSGQDQAADAVDDQKQQTDRQTAPSGRNELESVAKDDRERGGLAFALFAGPPLSSLALRKPRAHRTAESSQTCHVREPQQEGIARDFVPLE